MLTWMLDCWCERETGDEKGGEPSDWWSLWTKLHWYWKSVSICWLKVLMRFGICWLLIADGSLVCWCRSMIRKRVWRCEIWCRSHNWKELGVYRLQDRRIVRYTSLTENVVEFWWGASVWYESLVMRFRNVLWLQKSGAIVQEVFDWKGAGIYRYEQEIYTMRKSYDVVRSDEVSVCWYESLVMRFEGICWCGSLVCWLQRVFWLKGAGVYRLREQEITGVWKSMMWSRYWRTSASGNKKCGDRDSHCDYRSRCCWLQSLLIEKAGVYR
jgi:hypothetical protein